MRDLESICLRFGGVLDFSDGRRKVRCWAMIGI